MIRSGMVQFADDLEPFLVPIDSVRPHPENYNNGDVEAIMDSIVTNGMYRPIFTQESTSFIVAGNHTWMALKELGSELVPVMPRELSDIQAKKIILADNEIARKAKPDLGMMQSLLDQIQHEDSLLGTGFSDADLTQLRALNDIPPDLDEGNHMQWPTLCFQIPPHVKRAFYAMTEQAGGDNERFQLMLRLAGWDGKRA